MKTTTRLGLLLSLAALAASGCTWIKRTAYEGFGRDSWQQPEEVIRALQLREGDRVADLGAGGGYFTFRLARAVGPSGQVYAVDVDRGMIEYLQKRSEEEGAGNLETVLADYDDPRIPAPGVDLIFTCNTYHHLAERRAYFEHAKRYLRPGGRVAVVEYRPRQSWLARVFLGGHATSAETIREELGAAGYRLEAEHDFLPSQNFLVFRLNGS